MKKNVLLSLVLCVLTTSPFLVKGQEMTNFTLEQALAQLPAFTSGYFATVDGDKPDLRGWQYQGFENGRFIFATANNKDVYKQMQKNPNVAFACGVGEYQFRISGKLTEVTDATEKKRLFEKISPGVKQMYQSWDNPILVVFTVSDGQLRVSKSFSPYQAIAC